ncbi:hemolysin family protein [Terracidiphilus gabretensis]|uniref:hemolysin family protein n=1 Tax=Terracidiphilus gabretensis TaxID=1577687 RepID=UPI00071B214C|nr:hemolysin family protein [Terracidiphilus gabretensis]
MSVLAIVLVAILALVVALASYIVRIYAEYGKILSREVEENLDSWEETVEPQLGLGRDHAELCASLAQLLALGLIALEFGAVLFDRDSHMGRPTAAEIVQAVLGVVLVAVFCGQVFPWLLFERTRGKWVKWAIWPIRLLLWSMTPISVLVRFFYSLVALSEEPVSLEDESSGDVEALLEAGEEEGILEETDRELVRSAVEFGDTLVREIMTPRPKIFAVPATLTLEQFLMQLKEKNFSRVPVYAGSLDNITGIAFAHDLLQIADVEARTQTVESIQRPAAFVPETKRGYELLREMQREKQHMRIVIDEYGGVAGLVTIEDLLEQIVGDIRDEHEEETPVEDPQRERDGAWIVPGGFAAGELGDLFNTPVEIDGDYEATTVGGLVSEIEGRIPLPGEVVLLESAGLRIEVISSTDRRVERVRVFPPAGSGSALDQDATQA